MKRNVAILLMLAMLMSALTACGNEKNDQVNDSKQADSVVEEAGDTTSDEDVQKNPAADGLQYKTLDVGLEDADILDFKKTSVNINNPLVDNTVNDSEILQSPWNISMDDIQEALNKNDYIQTNYHITTEQSDIMDVAGLLQSDSGTYYTGSLLSQTFYVSITDKKDSNYRLDLSFSNDGDVALGTTSFYIENRGKIVMTEELQEALCQLLTDLLQNEKLSQYLIYGKDEKFSGDQKYDLENEIQKENMTFKMNRRVAVSDFLIHFYIARERAIRNQYNANFDRDSLCYNDFKYKLPNLLPTVKDVDLADFAYSLDDLFAAYSEVENGVNAVKDVTFTRSDGYSVYNADIVHCVSESFAFNTQLKYTEETADSYYPPTAEVKYEVTYNADTDEIMSLNFNVVLTTDGIGSEITSENINTEKMQNYLNMMKNEMLTCIQYLFPDAKTEDLKFPEVFENVDDVYQMKIPYTLGNVQKEMYVDCDFASNFLGVQVGRVRFYMGF